GAVAAPVLRTRELLVGWCKGGEMRAEDGEGARELPLRHPGHRRVVRQDGEARVPGAVGAQGGGGAVQHAGPVAAVRLQDQEVVEGPSHDLAEALAARGPQPLEVGAPRLREVAAL